MGCDGAGCLALRDKQYTILTAARTCDTIGAVRTELDRAGGFWTVPAARLKGKKGARKRDHVVPLSDRAPEILEARGVGLPVRQRRGRATRSRRWSTSRRRSSRL